MEDYTIIYTWCYFLKDLKTRGFSLFPEFESRVRVYYQFLLRVVFLCSTIISSNVY